ncbi:MAG: ABC transporter ATP-binding protein, partial [Campylobacter sp.]|nr:ABC transporter ATP-binding protein [Campylobacter sp.]
MKFEILNLSCGYGKKLIVKNFNASLQDGEILCLLGQNGIGKTTIFKSVLGFLKPFGGQVFLGEQNLSALSDIERAKALSYVPQAHTPPFAFKVIDVVLMGRTPYLGTFENPTRADVAIAYEKLEMLGMSEFCDRVYTDLSGGERQMVLISRALEQDSRVIMLDETNSNLDFGNQIKTLKALTEL